MKAILIVFTKNNFGGRVNGPFVRVFIRRNESPESTQLEMPPVTLKSTRY